MNHKHNACPTCNGRSVYRSKPMSGGGHAPDFLDGLGTWIRSAKFDVLLCADCGVMRLVASEEARAKVSQSKKWTRMS